MVENEDWLMRPVLRGLLSAESLVNGAVDMNYIALLNEALDVEQENGARVQAYEARRRQQGG